MELGSPSKRKNTYPLMGLLVEPSGRAAFLEGALVADCSVSKLMGRRGMDSSSRDLLLDGVGMGGPPSWTGLSLEVGVRDALSDALEEAAPGVSAVSMSFPLTLRVNWLLETVRPFFVCGKTPTSTTRKFFGAYIAAPLGRPWGRYR